MIISEKKGRGFEEEDKEILESESILSFRFQTYEEFMEKNGEFINVSKEAHFTDEEVSCEFGIDAFVNSGGNFDSTEEMSLPQISPEEEGSAKDSTNVNSVDEFLYVERVVEDDNHQISLETEMYGNAVETEFKNGYNHFPDDDDGNESLVSDSDSDSMVSTSKFTFTSSIMDSISDGLFSDIDFDRAFEVDTSMEFDREDIKSTHKVVTETEDLEFQNISRGYGTDDFEDEDEEILDDLKKLQESELESGNDTLDEEHEAKPKSKQNLEKPNSGEQLSSDSDEQNGLETQWEHQDLVEQLKMEIKKVRAIGLPTILEESESPKIIDDLKPWKIEEKFQHEDAMDELHKFYNSYRERMRKLDILNYQKMYGIGFLGLKDPLQSFTRHKISAMATIVSLDCWPCKAKSTMEVHQPVMKKFTKELESDLEMVYVGHMCLSWEFLRWEYGKVLELWDSDPHGIHHYNEAADKFQQFQVFLTRFIEDDSFEGPRVQHYVKSRCVLRNLLQVPLILEDNMRDRKKERKIVIGKDAITSVKLVEIVEESIRIFWQFIRADKDTSNAVLVKCRRSSNVELQNPADAKLLAEVQSSLQKKEKKLKELSKTENCILRKLQKHQEDGSDHVSYFFSQVDLILVSRVLKMSKISTEQLGWCSDKLHKIHIVGRKLHVEPSFMLFPCS